MLQEFFNSVTIRKWDVGTCVEPQKIVLTTRKALRGIPNFSEILRNFWIFFIFPYEKVMQKMDKFFQNKHKKFI